MNRASLIEGFMTCLSEAQKHGDIGASVVLEVVNTDAPRRLRAVQILMDGNTFFETLLLYLSKKGQHPVEFYAAANISAQTWNQMQDRKHNVSKTTVFRAVLTLKLDYLDAAILMEKAGYTFRSNDKMDMFMTCLLMLGIYDQSLIDELLNDNGLPTLFSLL